jgi:hypothetical protein
MTSLQSILYRADFRRIVANDDFIFFRKLLGDILYSEYYLDLVKYVNDLKKVNIMYGLISYPPNEQVAYAFELIDLPMLRTIVYNGVLKNIVPNDADEDIIIPLFILLTIIDKKELVTLFLAKPRMFAITFSFKNIVQIISHIEVELRENSDDLIQHFLKYLDWNYSAEEAEGIKQFLEKYPSNRKYIDRGPDGDRDIYVNRLML